MEDEQLYIRSKTKGIQISKKNVAQGGSTPMFQTIIGNMAHESADSIQVSERRTIWKELKTIAVQLVRYGWAQWTNSHTGDECKL